MNFQKKYLFASVTLFSAIAGAVATTIYFKTSGLSSFTYYKDSSGALIAQKTIQNYDIIEDYKIQAQQPILYLLETQLTNSQYLNVDGVQGSLKWDVRSGNKLQNVLWSKTEQANSYGISDLDEPYMLTGLEGCCDSRTGYRLYDVTSGRLIISFNDFTESQVVRHPFTLDIPNSKLGYRFIGVIAGESTRDLDFVKPDDGYSNIAWVKYASKTKFYQRIQVDMTVKSGWGASILDLELEADPTVANSDKIEFRNGIASMWNIDGATDPSQIQGVQLRMVVNGGDDDKTIIIPIRNDRLNLEKAQVPTGVKIHAL